MAWSLDPTIIAGLALLAILYARGQIIFFHRARKYTLQQRRHTWAFGGALAALIAALLSPLDPLAEQFLSAHMMQHSLLMLAAAPLLAFSSPMAPLLMALPPGLRRAIGLGWRRSAGLRTAWRWISHPAAAWLIQAAILWIWHIPSLYQAAVASDSIHALEHLSMLGAALLFWWVALRASKNNLQERRRGYLAGTFYLLSAVLPWGLLGILLALAPSPWYPIYAHHPGPFSPLADQQLAATMMWAPSGTVYLLAAVLKMKSHLSAESKVSGQVS